VAGLVVGLLDGRMFEALGAREEKQLALRRRAGFARGSHRQWQQAQAAQDCKTEIVTGHFGPPLVCKGIHQIWKMGIMGIMKAPDVTPAPSPRVFPAGPAASRSSA